jgi:hypothetical protein
VNSPADEELLANVKYNAWSSYTFVFGEVTGYPDCFSLKVSSVRAGKFR